MAPVTHTNVARRIVNSLIVARFKTSSATFATNIVEKSELNSTTSSFILQPVGSECRFLAPASTDYEAFGKHFLVRSFGLMGVKRHYTLCQSIKKETYDELLKAI